MTGRATTPLEAYYEEADRMILLGPLRFLTLFLTLVFLIKKPVGMVLMCLSFLFTSFLLFSLLELFPSLIIPLHLDKISYYTVKAYYEPDDELAYKGKPFQSHTFYNFRGDRYSSVYGIEVPPVTVQFATDEDGFRNSRTTRFSDVVVIGDSYIEDGINEADTFPKRLEKKLHGLTVANLAKGGYGPFNYLEVFKKYAIKKKPKFALFCFFEGNDIEDTKDYPQWKRGKGGHYGEIHAILMSNNFFQKYIAALGAVLGYVRDATSLATELALNKMRQSRDSIHPGVAVLNLGNKTYKVLLELPFVDGKPPKSTREMLESEEWNELKTILVEFKNVTKKNDIVPLVIYIPTATHIYAEYSTQQSGRHWLRIRDQQITLRKNMENAMESLAQELNMPLIDLVPLFKEAAKNGRLLYYPLDSHWNSEGRELAAAYVAGILKSKFIAPSKDLKQVRQARQSYSKPASLQPQRSRKKSTNIIGR